MSTENEREANMKPILEYLNYRRYMHDFYEERKKSSAFSWREFAKLAGFVSPTYLKLVCDGKTNLSKPGIQKVAKAMGLEGFERTFFEHLVQLDHAKSDAEKKAVLAKILQSAKENKMFVLNADGFRFCEHPVCPIVRELAPLMPGALPSEMAAKINSEVTALDVRDTLQFLVKTGLLKKTGENSYEQTSKMVKISKDALPLTVRSMNREMGRLGFLSLDNTEVDERSVSGLTMGVDEITYRRIEREVNECRRKVAAIAGECKKINQVYRLNLQLFPLTKKVDET
jgi:uncharacterized protein (TIGR02147 family)